MAAEGAPAFVHLPELRAAGDRLAIAGEAAHYLGRVVRVRPGESVTATDGRGLVAALTIEHVGPAIDARITARRDVARESTLELWCGAPEGERGDWLVEKLAELGVAALRPVSFARGAWDRPDARRERWDRLAVAALRQSCSAWRLEVLPAVPLREALAGAGSAAARWLCRPGGRPPDALRQRPGHTVAVVGPSSGFEDDELKLLQESGFESLSLAGGRLRTETAGMCVAALWAAAASSPVT